MSKSQGTDRIDSIESGNTGPGFGSSEASTHLTSKSEQTWNGLEPAIEGEIIPRLMMAFHQPALTPRPAHPDADPTARLDEFVELVLHGDSTAATAYVQSLCSAGASLRAIYLTLITDCARRLGDMWSDDQCSFFDVTAGVTRLRQVLLELSFQFCAGRTAVAGSSALILPMPGEQHTFGQFMVVEFFRRAGWNVHTSASASNDAISRMLERHQFDLVGLSVSADRFLDNLGDTISRIRDASGNPDLKVLIGGRSVAAREGLAEEMGADATAGDGEAAVAAADRLLSAKNHV